MGSTASQDNINNDDIGEGVWTEDIKAHPENLYNFTYKGYECEIRRIRYSLHYCGYVQLSSDHPDYSKGYDDVDIEVHGDLTYSYLGKFGFDCAHYDDITKFRICENGHYWTFDEVKTEIEKMVDQFIERKDQDKKID
jgi:hypothetical protein